MPSSTKFTVGQIHAYALLYGLTKAAAQKEVDNHFRYQPRSEFNLHQIHALNTLSLLPGAEMVEVAMRAISQKGWRPEALQALVVIDEPMPLIDVIELSQFAYGIVGSTARAVDALKTITKMFD